MKLKNGVNLFVILGVVVFSGCSAKVSGSGGSPNSVPPELTGLNPSQPQQPAPATALEGRWTLTCAALSPQLYSDGEIDFSGNNYSTIMTLYTDSQCTTPFGDTQNASGTFTIPAAGQVNMTPSNGAPLYNVFEIDQKTLYTGLQPSSDPASRPQAVDKNLPFAYSGAAVIVTVTTN